MSYNHRPTYQSQQSQPPYHDQGPQGKMIRDRGEQRYDEGYTQAWDNNNYQYKQPSGNGYAQYTSNPYMEDYLEQPQQPNQVRMDGHYGEGQPSGNYTLHYKNAVPNDDFYEHQEQHQRYRAQYVVHEQSGYQRQNGALGNGQYQYDQRSVRPHPPRNNSLPPLHSGSHLGRDSRPSNAHGRPMQPSRGGLSNGYVNTLHQSKGSMEQDRSPGSRHAIGQFSGSKVDNRQPADSVPQASPPSQPKLGDTVARKPFLDPLSPVQMSFDNPFPVFPTKKNGLLTQNETANDPRGEQKHQEPPRPSTSHDKERKPTSNAQHDSAGVWRGPEQDIHARHRTPPKRNDGINHESQAATGDGVYKSRGMSNGIPYGAEGEQFQQRSVMESASKRIPLHAPQYQAQIMPSNPSVYQFSGNASQYAREQSIVPQPSRMNLEWQAPGSVSGYYGAEDHFSIQSRAGTAPTASTHGQLSEGGNLQYEHDPSHLRSATTSHRQFPLRRDGYDPPYDAVPVQLNRGNSGPGSNLTQRSPEEMPDFQKWSNPFPSARTHGAEHVGHLGVDAERRENGMGSALAKVRSNPEANTSGEAEALDPYYTNGESYHVNPNDGHEQYPYELDGNPGSEAVYEMPGDVPQARPLPRVDYRNRGGSRGYMNGAAHLMHPGRSDRRVNYGPREQNQRLPQSRPGPNLKYDQVLTPVHAGLQRAETEESYFSDPGPSPHLNMIPTMSQGSMGRTPSITLGSGQRQGPRVGPLNSQLGGRVGTGNAAQNGLPDMMHSRLAYSNQNGPSNQQPPAQNNTGYHNRSNVERPTQYSPLIHGSYHRPSQASPNALAQVQNPSQPGPRNNGQTALQTLRTQPDASHTNPDLYRNTAPDALPHHPTPVRPGLIQNESNPQPPKPPPIRQYNNVAAVTSEQSVQRNDSQQPRPVSARQKPVPVTKEELERLRNMVQSNSAEYVTHLLLVKKLVEAATVLADDGGRADAKTKSKNRERYIYEAHKLVKKLVSNNYPEAMFYLADCYGQGGLGLENDPKEAFGLYLNAAKAGHPQAAYRTAVCCEIGSEDGGGTRKDPLKACQWYKRAAALGDVPGMYKVGMILLNGLLNQEKNFSEAVRWLEKAAANADDENPHALHELGLLYEATTNIANNNPGIIVRDEARALRLFTHAAKLGYKFSQFRLGQAYEYGLLGCAIDARQSIIWYTKAAAQGEHQGELALSGWYLTGSEGILEHSDTEAYLWARKAACAEPPLPKAMFAMGYFTEVGIGCPRSLEEAKRWYGRAASYKFPKAQERLEELKKGGTKAQKNREKLSRNDKVKNEADCAMM